MSLAGNDRNEFRFPSVLILDSQLVTLKNDGHPVEWIDVPWGGFTRLETGAIDSHPISLSDLQIPFHRMTSGSSIYVSATVTPAGCRCLVCERGSHCATVRPARAHGWLPGMARRTGSELREEAWLFVDTMDSVAWYNGTGCTAPCATASPA